MAGFLCCRDGQTHSWQRVQQCTTRQRSRRGGMAAALAGRSFGRCLTPAPFPIKSAAQTHGHNGAAGCRGKIASRPVTGQQVFCYAVVLTTGARIMAPPDCVEPKESMMSQRKNCCHDSLCVTAIHISPCSMAGIPPKLMSGTGFDAP